MQTIPSQQILDYLRGRRSEIVDFLSDLVLAESPSLVPEAQQKSFQLLAGELGGLGYDLRRLSGQVSGGMLLAQPRRRVRGRPAQLLLGHVDTVWPLGTLGDMPLVVDGDVMRGPGVFDMKAGLTQIVFALQALHALGLEPGLTPVVLLNSDEELGSPDSKRIIRRLASCMERAFVLEPSLGARGKLKTARKGVLRFDVEISGRAAHAGLAPEQGASAIIELSYVIQKLAALNDPLRGVTVNVGVVRGGTRPNVIAPSAWAEVDVRVPSAADAEQAAGAIMVLQAETPGTSIRVIEDRRTLPLERTPRNRRLWEQARMLGEALGLDLQQGAVGGASDGNTTSQVTATLDGLGAVGDGAHARHEFVVIDRVVERTALLASLLLLPADAG